MSDGSIYVGSGYLGSGTSIPSALSSPTKRPGSAAARWAPSLAIRSTEASGWPNRYAVGLDRLRGAATDHYAVQLFCTLANSGSETSSSWALALAKVLVGFRQTGNTPGSSRSTRELAAS